MVLVGRKGKLSISDTQVEVREVAWQRYEDVLTADAFGAYRYLPPRLGLLPLLNHAVGESGLSFSHFLGQHGVELSSLDVVRLRFWPTFANGREPDVFALLASTQHDLSVALLIEAKLHAAQHEIEGQSQLGHYLIQHLKGNYSDGCLAWGLPERPRPLLFITNQRGIPSSELARARADVAAEQPDVEPDTIGLFWVNWALVGLEAKRLWRIHRDEVDSAPWVRHLLDLYEEIRDRDLLPRPSFSGISLPPLGRLPRQYNRSYRQQIPRMALPRSIFHRKYIGAATASVGGRYVRSYQLPVIGTGRLPAIFYHTSERSHDR